MILKDEDTLKRLNSPMNLINRLRNSNNDSRKNAMTLFTGKRKEVIFSAPNELQLRELSTSSGGSDNGGVTHPPENTSEISFNPFLKKNIPAALPELPAAPTIDTILTNTDSQIKLGLAHDNALALLNKSLETLSENLHEVKADKLPQVILAASKTVDGIRRERNEAAKNNRDREVHYHFYTPEQRKVEEFEVIDIGEVKSIEAGG